MKKLIYIKDNQWIIVDMEAELIEYYKWDDFDYSDFSENPNVISHSHPELPNTLPITNIEEIKQQLGIVDVEKLTYDYATDFIEDKDLIELQEAAYKEGYNQALSDNQNKYSEEDMRKAMKYASEITNNKMKNMENYIQSLQPKTEWNVEIDEHGKVTLI